jgi:zinc protease
VVKIMVSTFVATVLGSQLPSTVPAGSTGGPLPAFFQAAGLDAVLAEKHDTPLVSIAAAFPTGGYFDPSGKEGLASFTGNMLLRGTRTRSREQIENALDFLGASLSVDVNHHSFVVRGQVLKRNLDPLVDLIAEILREPAFPEEEISKLREETIAQLKLELEDDNGLARRNYLARVYRGHPYAHDLDGTPASLRTIGRGDVDRFYGAHVDRAGVLLGGAGDLVRADLERIAGRLRDAVREGKAERRTVPFLGSITGRHILLVDKPERTQTQFFLGHPAIDVNHPDWFPLTVFVTAFAGRGMFQSQYMQEIRVKRGWSYGASGALDARRDGGTFFLHTFPAVKDTLPALKLSLELLEKAVHGAGITDHQIRFAKNYLVRSYPFLVDTPEKVVSQLMGNRFAGRPDDFLRTYTSRIEAVTPEMARAAARKHLTSKNLVISVLCTAKDFKATIQKELGAESLEIVPYDRL